MDASRFASSSSGGDEMPVMDKRLFKAATTGDTMSMYAMAAPDRSILFGETPEGNTCLHISSIHGHHGFCNDVLDLEESLLAAVNFDEETPLIAAVRSHHLPLASLLLGRCCQSEFRHAILQQDRHGFSALHHAIRNGHKDLALELITAEPALSEVVSKYNESPMFFALMRDFTNVCEKLMQNPLCAYSGGQHGWNSLHDAVNNGNKGARYM
jgi:ankyrin repeat protein